MHTLLQTAAGAAEVSAGWGGLQVAIAGVLLSVLTPLGIYAATYVRGRSELTKKDLELKQSEVDLRKKELELKHLEMEERIRMKLKAAALDAAAIADETSRGREEPLSGQAKASIAAAKLVELEPAAERLEGSRLNDMVKLGVAQLRASGATTFFISPSMAPPPDHVQFPRPPALPAVHTPATKTSPERPGAKR